MPTSQFGHWLIDLEPIQANSALILVVSLTIGHQIALFGIVLRIIVVIDC